MSDPATDPAFVNLLLWNIEWARAESARGREIAGIIRSHDSEVYCLTELHTGMLPDGGHGILAEGSSGYPGPSDRKKVALWSSQPWEKVDAIGSPHLPGGRFVSGVTHGIRFIGVCIPWHAAHVSTGRRDRALWEDHRSFLDGLKGILDRHLQDDLPVCLLGDFNQIVPCGWQPPEVFDALTETLSSRLTLQTSETHTDEALIDHVATSPGLAFEIKSIIPKTGSAGNKLSDHVGVFGRLVAQDSKPLRKP